MLIVLYLNSKLNKKNKSNMNPSHGTYAASHHEERTPVKTLQEGPALGPQKINISIKAAQNDMKISYMNSQIRLVD